MKPPDFEYARPSSVEEAVGVLAASGGDAKVLAGGQSLVPLLNFRLAAPSVLVDVNRVDTLAHLTLDGETLRIGATTRMRALELDPMVRDLVPVLAAAARWVGHVQIRNRGTIGGSVAHADPAAEVPAVCLLLDAELVALGPAGERRIPADDFFAGFLTTTLAEDELLTEIRIPVRPAPHWGFREYAQRRGDFALAGAAASGSLGPDGIVDAASLVVFGTADRPVRCRTAEAELTGQPPTADRLDRAAEAAATEASADDPRPDAAYRRLVARTMVRRALGDAFDNGAKGREEVS
ncbi:MAG TPA: xanthine dehydrogenase family protein subunit M [Candidatus Limnocylindrales bacterium]